MPVEWVMMMPLLLLFLYERLQFIGFLSCLYILKYTYKYILIIIAMLFHLQCVFTKINRCLRSCIQSTWAMGKRERERDGAKFNIMKYTAIVMATTFDSILLSILSATGEWKTKNRFFFVVSRHFSNWNSHNHFLHIHNIINIWYLKCLN